MTFPIAFTEKMKIGNTHANTTDYSMTTEQKLTKIPLYLEVHS